MSMIAEELKAGYPLCLFVAVFICTLSVLMYVQIGEGEPALETCAEIAEYTFISILKCMDYATHHPDATVKEMLDYFINTKDIPNDLLDKKLIP